MNQAVKILKAENLPLKTIKARASFSSGRPVPMQTLDDLAGWRILGYRWLPDDDFEIDFESAVDSTGAWAVTFKGAIAACVLGPWGEFKRSAVSDASEGPMDGILSFSPGELNEYLQYELWFDDASKPGAIIVAESLAFRSFELKRGMDL